MLVKEYVKNILLYSNVFIIPLKWGKWGGRMIADVFINDNELLSDHLIEMGYANEYNGKKKKEWTNDKLDLIINNLSNYNIDNGTSYN